MQNSAIHPVQNDIRVLTKEVGPRGAATENEQKASRYISSRMGEVLDDVNVEEFATVETAAWLESGFHAEFIIVYLISLKWPFVAACYGAVAMFLFIAETTGFALLSRLMRQERSQNVVGRTRRPYATRKIAVIAHYDTPKRVRFYRPNAHIGMALYWLRFAFIVTVVAGAGLASVGGMSKVAVDTLLALRSIAAANLGLMAMARFYRESRSEYVVGANDNASGVAAMLHLAKRFAAEPPHRTEVWFIATGSAHAACCGMQRIMEQKIFDPTNTMFINIEEVGRGPITYTTREGMLKSFGSSPVLVEAAHTVEANTDVNPTQRRVPYSEAVVALAHDFHAMTVTGAPETQTEQDDTEIDVPTIEQAASFVESLVRHVDDIPPENWSLQPATVNQMEER